MDLTTARIYKNSFLDIHTIKKSNGFLNVNGKIFFPIQVTKSFDRGNEINIYNARGMMIGYIIFSKNTNYNSVSSPEDLQIALMNELQVGPIPATHTFKYDYLIVKEDKLKIYLRNYKNTCRLWGSYYHAEDLKGPASNHTLTLNSIIANENLYYPSFLHRTKTFQAITEPDPFTRFLRLYHLIELQFDVQTVIEINNLSKDYKEIGKILKDYRREDIDRLTYMIKLNCTNLPNLFQKLDLLKNYKKLVETLLFDFGKDSNPIRTFEAFESIIAKGGFTLQNVQNINIHKFIAYCIYRIRSSIAHNKFGEYILTNKDEEFIINFGEPLIKEVIIQCFTKNT